MPLSVSPSITTEQPLTETLTEEQTEAWDYLRPRLKSEGTLSSLQGYAGTGKTYLTAAMAQHFITRNYDVRIAALTHQAKYVLQEHMPPEVVSNASISTIHSLLGLKLVPDGKGGQKLTNDKMRELDLPAKEKSVILVDEASMLGGNLWRYVDNASMKTPASWLFIGDPAQLPPVMEKESDALFQDGVKLTEIVRQARDNPIIETATAIREGYHWQDFARNKTTEDGEARGIFAVDNKNAILASAERIFGSEEYQENPYLARVLAARNRVVEDYNQQLKDRLFPDSPEWTEGMWGIVQTSWAPEDQVKAFTSELLHVDAAEKVTRPVAECMNFRAIRLPLWKLNTTSDSRSQVTVFTLAEEGQKKFDEELEDRKQYALENGGGRKWKPYYRLKETLCEMRYAYASTVHKAQGMSVETSFVDMSDIRTFPGGERVKQPLRYVAFTRAEERVGVLV